MSSVQKTRIRQHHLHTYVILYNCSTMVSVIPKFTVSKITMLKQGFSNLHDGIKCLQNLTSISLAIVTIG